MLTVAQHPVLADRLVRLRDHGTPFPLFRAALQECAAILAIEATRDLPLTEGTVQTPLEQAPAQRLARPVAVVPVLRAGLAMVDGFLRLLPDAAVGHLGLARDEETLLPRGYLERLPPDIGSGTTFVLDPMLATGGSAVFALDRVRAAGATDLRLVCLVAAPEGVAAVEASHPDVPIVAAALDRRLDEKGYIRPGLGDAGDRVFGTLDQRVPDDPSNAGVPPAPGG